jgi:hypothetical protein
VDGVRVDGTCFQQNTIENATGVITKTAAGFCKGRSGHMGEITRMKFAEIQTSRALFLSLPQYLNHGGNLLSASDSSAVFVDLHEDKKRLSKVGEICVKVYRMAKSRQAAGSDGPSKIAGLDHDYSVKVHEKVTHPRTSCSFNYYGTNSSRL